MGDWERIGGGRYDIYRKRKKKIDWGAVAGVIFWIFIIGLVLNSCTG